MNTLLNPAIKKIAIANPAHAPYGQRAEEALHYYQLYDRIKDKLVMGENIAQTAQYAQSGAADIGIIALSLALSPAMQQSGGKYWLIPADSHRALQQGFVLLPHAKDNKGAVSVHEFRYHSGSQGHLKILRLQPAMIDWQPLWLSLRLAGITTLLLFCYRHPPQLLAGV